METVLQISKVCTFLQTLLANVCKIPDKKNRLVAIYCLGTHVLILMCLELGESYNAYIRN